MTQPSLARRLVAEGLGTSLLVAAIVGSGIMAENLAQGNAALMLLANSFATSAMLAVLIIIFSSLSGAHFNPAVSLVMVLIKKLSCREFIFYALVQVVGACLGTMLAHLMFELPLVTFSTHMRQRNAQTLSELIASLGLIVVILCTSAKRSEAMPYTVAAYIGSAYWFTASTSFANPAVTVARSLTDSFSGIRPDDVIIFITAQFVGAVLAMFLCNWLLDNKKG